MDVPREAKEDAHELDIHFQQISSIPSYPQPVHDDWLQISPRKPNLMQPNFIRNWGEKRNQMIWGNSYWKDKEVKESNNA